MRRKDESGQIAYGIGVVVAVVVVVFGLVWGILFVQGWKSVPPDKIMLHYTGGPIQGVHFVEVVQPGTHTKFYGLMDTYYKLPATQRTYVISKDANAGDEHQVDYLSAPSDDNVLFTFEATAYFKLNTKSDVIRQFMEQICLHDHCTDLSPGGGWDKMLKQYFRPAIENAVRLEVEKYNREQLYRDPNTLLAIQKAVGSNLKERINAALGGEYFCGPNSSTSVCDDFGFVLKNPTPPEQLIDAYADSAAAAQNVVTAQQNAEAKAAAAQGDANAQKIRASTVVPSPAAIDYIRAQALASCAGNPSGSCKLTFVTGTTPVLVGP